MRLISFLSTGLLLLCCLLMTTTPARAQQIFLPLLDNNPSLRVLFSDDFSKPSNGWATGDYDPGSLSYAEGEYEIVAKHAVYLYDYPVDLRFTHYTFEADARGLASEAPQGYGLVFGDVEGGNYFFFVVDGNQQFTVRRGGEGSPHTWQTTSALFKAPPAMNRLRADHVGDLYVVSINGQEVARGTFVQSTGGEHIGLVVYGEGVARFDNVAVRALP